MKSKGAVVIMVLMFALAIGAGAVGAKLVGRTPPANPVTTTKTGTLADILQLTPEQSRRMRQIWEGVRETSTKSIGDAEGIQDTEDAELKDKILATDEQRRAFQDLRARSIAKLHVIHEKRNAAFNQAVQQTLKLLNPDQAITYKQLIRDRVGGLPDATGGRSSLELNLARDTSDTAR